MSSTYALHPNDVMIASMTRKHFSICRKLTSDVLGICILESLSNQSDLDNLSLIRFLGHVNASGFDADLPSIRDFSVDCPSSFLIHFS